MSHTIDAYSGSMFSVGNRYCFIDISMLKKHQDVASTVKRQWNIYICRPINACSFNQHFYKRQKYYEINWIWSDKPIHSSYGMPIGTNLLDYVTIYATEGIWHQRQNYKETAMTSKLIQRYIYTMNYDRKWLHRNISEIQRLTFSPQSEAATTKW